MIHTVTSPDGNTVPLLIYSQDTCTLNTSTHTHTNAHMLGVILRCINTHTHHITQLDSNFILHLLKINKKFFLFLSLRRFSSLHTVLSWKGTTMCVKNEKNDNND